MNDIAPEGKIYICLACGKLSRDRYGDLKLSRGWDVACMLNCVLVDYPLMYDADGKVICTETPSEDDPQGEEGR